MANSLGLISSIIRSLVGDEHDHEHAHEHEEITGARIGWAIGLAAIAALFTLCGSVVVFCMDKGRHALVMSVSVAVSAGVMLYISFIEIFNESVASFTDSHQTVPFAVLYASVTVFSSIIIALVFDVLMGLPCVDRCTNMPKEISFSNEERTTDSSIKKATHNDKVDCDPSTSSKDSQSISIAIDVTDKCESSIAEKKKDILLTGVVTCIAVIMHNIPEGLVTFFATIGDPSFGIIMCVAMALHNVPEGVGVAALIYHATASKTKAVLAVLLAGIAEILGAVLGYGLLMVGGKSDILLGIALAFSAGIMIFVSVKKLIRLAYKIDHKDRYVSYCILGGMFLMAISLVLLEFFSSHAHTVHTP